MIGCKCGGRRRLVSGWLWFRAECENAERRQGEDGGVGLVVDFVSLGLDSPEVALIAAAIDAGVAVESLAPETGAGKSDAILMPRHRRQVQNDEDATGQIFVLADEGEDAV